MTTSPNTQSGEDLRQHLIDWLSRRGNVEEVVNLIHQRESSLLDEVEDRLAVEPNSDARLELQAIRQERGLASQHSTQHVEGKN